MQCRCLQVNTPGRAAQRLSRTCLGHRNRSPERPKSGSTQGGSKCAQDPPRRATSGSRQPPEPPNVGFRAALAAIWGPPRAQEPSEGLQEAILDPPTGRFSTSRERFCTLLHPPGGIFKTVLWAKLMQAYGQHRLTPLCNSACGNFCMWISTATDSRSRSTNPCLAKLSVLGLGLT